jgi:Flp pilus assembly pilin Flp
LWADEGGLSSVEYAMLLAIIAGGIIMAADLLSGAVSNQITNR